jgi:hypothetical protein
VKDIVLEPAFVGVLFAAEFAVLAGSNIVG